MNINRRCVLWLLLLLLVPSAGFASNPGPKNGLQDLSWGDRPTADMVPIEDDTFDGIPALRAMDMYGRKGPAVLGAVPKFVLYFFYKERLCRVRVEWGQRVDDVQFARMSKELRSAWGSEDEIETANDPLSTRLWLSADQSTVAVLSYGEGQSTSLQFIDDACNREAAASVADL